jgi:hypothetical protein
MVEKDLQQTRVIDAMLLAKVVLVKFQSASIGPSGILTSGIVTCPVDSAEFLTSGIVTCPVDSAE